MADESAIIKWGFTADNVAKATLVLFLGTIATTYSICAFVEHTCPVFLPTISDTWVPPPGNYISRITVNIGCFIFSLGNFMVYFYNKHGNPSGGALSDAQLLTMSQVAVFCLSWVGAICDSTKPSCMGNGTIHSAAAVTFFILYDLYMILVSNLPRRSETKHLRVFNILAVLSVLTKVRFVPGIGHVMNETPLAIFEWSDVAFIAFWTAGFIVQNCQNYVMAIAVIPQTSSAVSNTSAEEKKSSTYSEEKMALIDVPASAEGDKPIKFFTASSVALASVTLFSVTFLTTWIVSVAQGGVPKHELPTLSNMWVKQPNDWFARWGIVMGCNLMYITEATVFYMRKSQVKSGSLVGEVLPALSLVVGLVSSFSFAISAVVDIAENEAVHDAAFKTFFLGYDLYMVLTLINGLVEMKRVSCVRFSVMFVMALVAIISAVRFASVAAHIASLCCTRDTSCKVCETLYESADGMMDEKKIALFEWVNLVAWWGFVAVTVVNAPDNQGKRYGFGIIQKSA